MEIPVIDVSGVAGPVVLCFGRARGGAVLVHIRGKFWNMLVRVQRLEIVCDQSTTSWVISYFTKGLLNEGSVRIIDQSSLVHMTVEKLNGLAFKL